MSTYYLINNVRVGGQFFFAGALLSDAQDNVAGIAAAGGVLVDSSDATVAAAALIAQGIKLDGGDPTTSAGIMLAAYDASRAAVIATLVTSLAHDVTENYPSLASPGTNYVTQYAAGAAIDDSTGPFTGAPTLPYRTVRAVLGAGGVSTVLTVTGTDPNGVVQTESKTLTAAGTFELLKVWKTITRIQTDVDPSGTLNIRTGIGFAVTRPYSGTPLLAVDNVLEALATGSTGSTGVIIPTTAPNGTHRYSVRYRPALAPIPGP